MKLTIHNIHEHLYYCETSSTFLRWNRDCKGGQYKNGDVAGFSDKKYGSKEQALEACLEFKSNYLIKNGEINV